MAAGDLITLSEYKTGAGFDPTDSSQDTKLQQAITFASDAIRAYMDRDVGLGLGSVGEVRTYNYDGNGILEIDDVAFGSITAVTLDTTTLVAANRQFQAFPDRKSAVHDWLKLIPIAPLSPAMGFTWNLDTLYGLYGGSGYGLQPVHTVTVTATFGWPTVPNDIKQAAILTTADFASTVNPVQSRHFQSYSEQYAVSFTAEAIPPRAVALLDLYTRRKL